MESKQLTKGSSFFLDIIRVFSVQLVVIGHGISYCEVFVFLTPPHFPFLQNIAVVIFFILSGYLISSSIFYKLSTDPMYSFRSYFIDRFSRIFSALLPALLFVIIIDLTSQALSPHSYAYKNAFNLETLFGNVLMLQDFPILKHLHMHLTSFGSARPLWTLAIEWWIYMWFGVFVIKICRREKPSIKLLVLFLFLCIVPVFNLVAGRGHGLTLYWLFGVLVYLLYNQLKKLALTKALKRGVLFFLLVIAAVRIFITFQEYDAIFAFLLSICLLIGIELWSTIEIASYNTEKLVKFLANYSYTLYLIHFTLFDFMVVHLKSLVGAYTLFAGGFLISNILAAAIGYFSEGKLTPFVKQRLKTRFAVGRKLK